MNNDCEYNFFHVPYRTISLINLNLLKKYLVCVKTKPSDSLFSDFFDIVLSS